MKKIYFFLVAMLMGITTNAAEYVIGGMATGGWPINWTEDESTLHFMTEKSAGVYEFDYEGESSGAFLIVEWNGTAANWNNKIGTNGSQIIEGEAYKYTVGGENLSWSGYITNPHFVLDTNAKTITVTGSVSANHFDVVYMVGDFGSGWDTNTTAYPLAAVEGLADTYEGTYTITGTAAMSDYFYTVPKCGGQVLQLSGSDVTIDATTSGKEYTLATGDKSFACTPGTYTFKVVADQEANSAKVTITMTDAPEPDEYTIYWDNTTANWEVVYAYVVDADNAELEAKPGLELSDLGNGLWSTTVPSTYTSVTFNDGGTAEYGAYEIKNEYIYGPDQSGKPYEEPVDYSSWYVNVHGFFNGWGDNGVNPVDGISTHQNLTIGTSEFKVKIWNGSDDVYYSTGGAVATDQWVKINGNADANMTVAGAADGDNFDVKFNCATNEIYISKAGAIDYTGWYLNICGNFNGWSKDSGKAFNADGTAVNTYADVNTTFKVVVWNGTENIYYAKDGTLVAGEWNDVNANQDNMVLPEDLQTGSVVFTFDNNTKQLKIEKGGSDGIGSIEAEENVAPVYYNLQGVRVDTPANGLYIVVRGDKVAKEIVK